MKTKVMEVLSDEDLLSIRGGVWFYSEVDNKWYWAEFNDLDPDM